MTSCIHVTTRGGLWYDFCSFRFPDPVAEDLCMVCMKQFWSVFPDGFLEDFTDV